MRFYQEKVAAVVQCQNPISMSDHGAILAKQIAGRPKYLLLGWVDAVDALVSTMKIDMPSDHNRRRHAPLNLTVPQLRDGLLILLFVHREPE